MSALFGRFGLARRHDVLDRAVPAVGGQVEQVALGIAILDLVERIGIVALVAQHVGRAGGLDLVAGGVDVVDPDAEMIDAVERLLALVAERPALAVQQRDNDGAVRHVDAVAGIADHFNLEGVLEELPCLVEIGDRQRDVTQLGHDGSPFRLRRAGRTSFAGHRLKDGTSMSMRGRGCRKFLQIRTILFKFHP